MIEEINEFIDIDTSNQEIAKNSVIKIVTTISNQFNADFNNTTALIKILHLITEIIKEVETLSTINKQLSSSDKKQIAINLGYLVLIEIYKSKPIQKNQELQSYIKIYKEQVEPMLEMMIGISKVVNITHPQITKKINNCCPCF
jgi:hypothetical protein